MLISKYFNLLPCEFISNNLTCTSCKEGYTLINGTCFKSCDTNCLRCLYYAEDNRDCTKCKKTYYLKLNSTLKDTQYSNEYYCSKCPEGCIDCFDYYLNKTPISINCTSCLPGYFISNHICEKQCDVGEGNLCLTCDLNEKNKCSSCNPGYYLNENICESCEVENCIKCNEKGICIECINQYEVLNGLCFKTCKKGDNELCLECNNTPLQITENCLNCNNGYFLPNDINDKTKCYPCEIGCINCFGNINQSICINCEEGYAVINGKCIKNCELGPGELCLTCNYDNNDQNCLTCNEGYYLPNDINNKKRCKKCGEFMKKCHEENEQIIPDECYNPYIISGRYCMEQCIIGTEFNCLSCSEIPEKINQCQTCNIGYYLATDSDKKRCFQCSLGCKYCYGIQTNNICTECQNDFMLYEGKCVRNCDNWGEYEFCLTCNKEPGKNDRCETCNIGYYLPDYSTDKYKNKICRECPQNCLNCSGDFNNPNCHACINENFHLVNNSCILSCQYFQLHHNCDECINSIKYPTYAKCINCKPGYYLPKLRKIDENYNICQKCSMDGCVSCEGNDSFSNKCTKCEEGLKPIIDINNNIISCYDTCDIGSYEKCKSCKNGTNDCGECNEDFYLFEGKCIPLYHIFAKYKTTSKKQNITLMKSVSISKMKIDGKIITDPSVYYRFENPGVHFVLVNLTSPNVFMNLFDGNKNLISIEFSNNFASSKITYMNDCFRNCINLEYVDISKLDLTNNHCFSHFFRNDKKLKTVKFPKKDITNIKWFTEMFYNCESLTSIDMPYVYNNKAEYYDNMFYGCKNLEEIFLPNFQKRSYSNNKNMFIKVPKYATIVIGEPFLNSISSQLVGFENVIPF